MADPPLLQAFSVRRRSQSSQQKMHIHVTNLFVCLLFTFSFYLPPRRYPQSRTHCFCMSSVCMCLFVCLTVSLFYLSSLSLQCLYPCLSFKIQCLAIIGVGEWNGEWRSANGDSYFREMKEAGFSSRQKRVKSSKTVWPNLQYLICRSQLQLTIHQVSP